jgi:hypothetical protein
MDEAGEFRLKRGFTIPLVTLEGDIAGFSLAGEKLEVSPADRGMLTLLATYALGRSFLLREDDGRPMLSLSRREQEALQWAAEGKPARSWGSRSMAWTSTCVRLGLSSVPPAERMLLLKPYAEASSNRQYAFAYLCS